MFEKNFSLCTAISAIKVLAFLFRESNEPLSAFVLVLLLHDVRNLQSLRAGTLGVGKHMELRKVESRQKFKSFLEKFRCLASCAHNNVYADKRIGHGGMYFRYFFCKKLRIGGALTSARCRFRFAAECGSEA